MNEAERRQKIIATLKERGFLQDTGVSDFCFKGSVYIGHSKVNIELQIPDTLFSVLPIVRLIDRAQLPQTAIAHLEAFDRVCYANLSLLRLDPANAGGSALRVLEEVKSALEKSLAGRAQKEIATEFARYWDGYSITFISSLPETYTEGSIGHTEVFNSGEKAVFQRKGDESVRLSRQISTAVFLPVAKEISLANGVIQPKTVAQLDQWWAGNALNEHMSISKLHGTLLKDTAVIVSAPNAIVGVEIDPSGLFGSLRKKMRDQALRKYLVSNGSSVNIRGYVGTDASHEFITSRNLGHKNSPLSGKRIALAGCGTIGSHLARFLVQNGAGNQGNLLLVDDDQLSPGNLGRHLLGYQDIGRNKASALAEELEKFHPHVSISPISTNVQSAWSRVCGADLIIDATGVENLSEYMNLKAIEQQSSGQPCAILHVFLWQNGIAAQSFLNADSGSACYRCLKPGTQWRFDPRKDVNQQAEIISNRCGDGPYLPFSVGASVSAAALALDATLSFFSARSGPTLRTLNLRPDLAKQIKDSRPEKSKDCPVCN